VDPLSYHRWQLSVRQLGGAKGLRGARERGGAVGAGIGDLAGFLLCRFRLILVRIFCQSRSYATVG